MSTYDEEHREEMRKAYFGQLEAEKEIAEKEVAKLGQQAARLRDLASNTEWKWFKETYILPMVQKEHDEALDVKNRSVDQRDNSAHRYEVAKMLSELMESKAEALRAAVQEAVAKIPQ